MKTTKNIVIKYIFKKSIKLKVEENIFSQELQLHLIYFFPYY